ncbi:hypothetical protein SBM1_00014 [Synechococcus phage S-BM1]|nr:hypothetical protein SBM1_00014 [Synechococcus phage S-BM1]
MPLVNQEAERIVRGMKKNRRRFKDLYGKRDKEVMYATANKLAQKKQVKQPTWKSGQGFGEENKSGDSSLRDWFGKSKSSDGKPGWVQLGGKYAGKPCAKQPGQTTKPKCGSSKMKRNLNKDEEEAAFRRKQKEDPNPNRKGKAINVKTEETINERGDYWHPDPDKDRKLGGPGANQRAREDRGAQAGTRGTSSNDKKLRPGESYMDYAKRQKGSSSVSAKPKKKSLLGRLGLKKEEMEVQEGMGDVAIKAIRATQGKKPAELSKRTALIRKIKQKQLNSYLKKRDDKKKERVTNVGIGEELEWLTEEQFDEAAGEKDACYKKVKARYSVWPSAYASGALVKCRKVGAANWGNSKKEEFDRFQQVQEKCWKGYKRVGMKKKGDKLVPNCVPEEVQNEGAAWTKKSGKNSEGGLNEKGRKSYERENPGSDLKAPSKKVGNPRRASFCARMRGMKKKLTSKKTASDPDSRINKSLRAWNC